MQHGQVDLVYLDLLGSSHYLWMGGDFVPGIQRDAKRGGHLFCPNNKLLFFTINQKIKTLLIYILGKNLCQKNKFHIYMIPKSEF